MIEKNSANLPIDLAITEARRIEEDALYSAKGHFEAAARWGNWHFWIGISMTITAAVGGVAALKDYPSLAAALSFSAASFGALFTFIKPNEREDAHLKAGNAYKALNNDARMFWQIECKNLSVNQLVDNLKTLNERRNALNTESPQIPRVAYKRAKLGIKQGQATYSVDKP